MMRRLMAFAMVGGAGFAIDGGVLALLFHGLGADPYGARAVSFSCAVTATWLLNRRFTFHDLRAEAEGARAEYVRYLMVQILGALANLGVYAAAMITIPDLARWPVAALGLGAIAGLAVNYTLSLSVVFRRRI